MKFDVNKRAGPSSQTPAGVLSRQENASNRESRCRFASIEAEKALAG
jgi:hypothetical protein